MTYKQEYEKALAQVGKLKVRLLSMSKHQEEVSKQAELKATIAHEKRTIPKSGFGLFLLDMVLSFEKYILKIR